MTEADDFDPEREPTRRRLPPGWMVWCGLAIATVMVSAIYATSPDAAGSLAAYSSDNGPLAIDPLTTASIGPAGIGPADSAAVTGDDPAVSVLVRETAALRRILREMQAENDLLRERIDRLEGGDGLVTGSIGPDNRITPRDGSGEPSGIAIYNPGLPDPDAGASDAAEATLPAPRIIPLGEKTDADEPAATGGIEPQSQADDAALLTTALFGVAIGTARDESEAQRLWDEATAEHGDLIGALVPLVSPVESGANEVALMVIGGPFANAGEAAATCVRITDRGSSCIAMAYDGTPLAP